MESVGGGQDSSTLSGALRTSASTRRKTSSSSHSSQGLTFALPEGSVRADFVEIVRDLRDRATAFEATTASAISSNRSVKIRDDFTEFSVDEERYTLGDHVALYSLATEQSLVGVITAISFRDVVLRSGAGVRFSFLIGQLRTGRVSVSHDKESMENAELVRMAVEMRGGKPFS